MNICADSHSHEEECDLRIIDRAAVDRIRPQLSEDEDVRLTTTLFSALSDPTRFRLLEALLFQELCVCDLAQLAGISESGVSHQLRLLRDRGLVTYRRDGNRAVYRLADDHVRDLIDIASAHAREGTGR